MRTTTDLLTPAEMGDACRVSIATARVHPRLDVIDEKIARSVVATGVQVADAEPHTRRPTLDGKGARS